MAIDSDTVSSSDHEGDEGNIGELEVDPGILAGQNARMAQMDEMNIDPQLEFHCKALVGGLFDAFTITLAVVDVITDILIAIEWYRAGEMTFFWIGITIFILAQVGYSFLFMAMFDPRINGAQRPSVLRSFCTWLLVLPFGQLVPLIMWAVAVEVPGVQAILNALGFQFVGLDEGAHPDPVARYLLFKVKSHGGFIIESLLEALPQSLIQLIYIVRVGDVSALNVFSITISIISIASKGIVIAYHVDRPTFFFNYMCVVYDVFNIFTIVVWLFTFTAYDSVHHFFLFGRGIDIELFATIWLWKEFLLVCLPILTGVIASFLGLVEEIRDKLKYGCGCCRRPLRHYIKDGLAMTLLGIICLVCCAVVALPLLIVVETVRLILIPVLVFQSFDSLEQSHRATFYAKLYKFLFTGNDYNERFRCFLIASSLPGKGYHYDEMGRQTEAATLQEQIDKPVSIQYELTLRRDASAIQYAINCGKGNFSFSEFRKHRGSTVTGVIEYATTPVFNQGDGYGYERSCAEKVGGWMAGAYALLVCFPIIVLGSIYSFLFPLLAYFSRDVLGGEIPLLPLTLTSIQLGILGLMALLFPRVWRVAYLELHRIDKWDCSVDTVSRAIALYCSDTNDEVEMFYALRDTPQVGFPHLFRWSDSLREAVDYIPPPVMEDIDGIVDLLDVDAANPADPACGVGNVPAMNCAGGAGGVGGGSGAGVGGDSNGFGFGSGVHGLDEGDVQVCIDALESEEDNAADLLASRPTAAAAAAASAPTGPATAAARSPGSPAPATATTPVPKLSPPPKSTKGRGTDFPSVVPEVSPGGVGDGGGTEGVVTPPASTSPASTPPVSTPPASTPTTDVHFLFN